MGSSSPSPRSRQGDPRRLEREIRRLTYELEVATDQVPHLRALVEGTSELLALVAEDGTIVEHNRAFAAALGSACRELAGANVSSLFFSDEFCTDPLVDAGALAKLDEQSARLHGFADRGRALEIDLDRVEIHGRQLIVLAARLLDTQSRHTRELHEARLQVQELGERLEQERRQDQIARFESLSLLAGTLAHDFNNAFAIVHSNLEALRETMKDPLHLSLIADIVEGAQAARGLLERLRSFARDARPILSPLHLQPWLESLVRTTARASQARVELSLAQAPAWVQADEAQLARVLVNLLTNAIQAAGREAELEVQLRPAHREGPGWELDVLDRGPGIPERDLPRIFDPFFTTKAAGSGLGLPSSQRIVRAHRGWIEAHNRPGGGARFCVWLPVAVDELTPELSGLGVLLIHVKPRVQDVLIRALGPLGVDVYTAADAGEALSKYRLFTPTTRLVGVLDLIADDTNARLQTLARLRSVVPSFAAIALVPHGDHDLSESYRTLGFGASIALPCQLPELVAALTAASTAGASSGSSGCAAT